MKVFMFLCWISYLVPVMGTVVSPWFNIHFQPVMVILGKLKLFISILTAAAH